MHLIFILFVLVLFLCRYTNFISLFAGYPTSYFVRQRYEALALYIVLLYFQILSVNTFAFFHIVLRTLVTIFGNKEFFFFFMIPNVTVFFYLTVCFSLKKCLHFYKNFVHKVYTHTTISVVWNWKSQWIYSKYKSFFCNLKNLHKIMLFLVDKAYFEHQMTFSSILLLLFFRTKVKHVILPSISFSENVYSLL